MTISPDIKNQFLMNFQKGILQGRQLLNSANHQWASRLFSNLYFEIEKTEWLAPQKKRQLIMIIANSWWIYLNSLKSQKDKIDKIRYIDAYKRFFSFLSNLDEFDLFNNFWMILLKSFIKVDELSIEGITKFINSFSLKVKERGDYLKLIELQFLLAYLRKRIFSSDLFRFSLKILGEILYNLEPSTKALLLFVFMENVNIKYHLIEGSPKESLDFVQIINKIIAKRLPNYLKEDFSNMREISVNEQNFSVILSDLEELIYYLNNIGEFTWIIIIIRYAFTKLKEFQTIEVALSYIRKFVDFSINRNRFLIAYEIYDFLEDIFMDKTDLGYDVSLIELWVEACKKFVDIKERKYLLLSMEKLSNHLKTPQTPVQIYHYFYTCNYLWQFKSKFFTLETADFWRMMFYRALYEEKDFNLAQKIIPYLDENIREKLTDLNSLYNKCESIKNQIYSFEEDLTSINPDFILNQAIIRINSEGLISFRMISKDYAIVEGKITDELWNDHQIMEIFNDIFSGRKEKRYQFNIIEFGKLLYIFLPNLLRDFFKQLKVKKLDFIPHIYFILDKMTIPFGFLYDDDKFFMLKYSSGYKIGEPPLAGIQFGQLAQEESITIPTKTLFNVLLIEATNAKGPLKWNEEYKNKTLIFPFPDAHDELNHITDFFNTTENVNQFTILSGIHSTREKILSNISEGAFHIIHFVGNIFYSRMSPKDSYILTNDNTLITFNEIKKAIDKNKSNSHPFLFFNAQVFNVEGEKLNNVLEIFGEIIRQFDYNRIIGIITRTYPFFNEDTQSIIANFYLSLFNNESQGTSLLRARQQCKSGIAISSFLHFGKPWNKL
ncbi:MAG: CHAT domain-containing protein [Candidatus Hodarchaeota archaeon]